MLGTSRYAVYYEDTDFSGYVYHANYLKYFERAREDLLGLERLRDWYARGLHFVVARVEVDFQSPARHGDVVEVETEMPVGRAPVVEVRQSAWRAEAGGGSRRQPLVKAVVRLVAVDDRGRPRRIPPEFFDTAGRPAPRG